MTEKSTVQKENYLKAKQRVEELKKFYKHLSIFIIINAFLIGRRIYKDIDRGDTVIEALSDVSNYKIIFWWAVILVLHAIKVYGNSLFFSKDWEKEKIKKYMDE